MLNDGIIALGVVIMLEMIVDRYAIYAEKLGVINDVRVHIRNNILLLFMILERGNLLVMNVYRPYYLNVNKYKN